MRATGIVRRLDELGRITLPKEMRKTMSIKEGDPLEMFVEGQGIVLKRYTCKESIEYSVDALKSDLQENSASLGQKKTARLEQLLDEIKAVLGE